MSTLAPFDQAALAMLSYAGITAIPKDVIVLADDLQAVADEFSDDRPDDESATHAAHVLRQRIGGYANLKSYLATLHAGRNAARR